MKATGISSEMPYLHPGEMTRDMLDNGVSDSAIVRDYKKIGTVTGLPMYIDKHETHVIVVNPEEKTESGRMQQVFRMQFKQRHQLSFPNQFKNILQLSKVAVNRQHGTSGLATYVYKLLVSLGYTIVSDDTQFEPAQSLWKRIAADPGVKVYVADVEHGLFKDDNGAPILYNGANIPDQDIWTSGSEYTGQYRVLILTK